MSNQTNDNEWTVRRETRSLSVFDCVGNRVAKIRCSSKASKDAEFRQIAQAIADKKNTLTPSGPLK